MATLKQPARSPTRLERQLISVLIGWMCLLAVMVFIISQDLAGNLVASSILAAGSAALAATFLNRDWRLWLLSTLVPIISILSLPFADVNAADVVALESLLMALVVVGLYQTHIIRKRMLRMRSQRNKPFQDHNENRESGGYG